MNFKALDRHILLGMQKYGVPLSAVFRLVLKIDMDFVERVGSPREGIIGFIVYSEDGLTELHTETNCAGKL